MAEHKIRAGMQCMCGVMLYPSSRAQVDMVAALDQHRQEEAAIEQFLASAELGGSKP